MVQSQELLFPHENLEEFVVNGPIGFRSVLDINAYIGRNGLLNYTYALRQGRLHDLVARKAFEAANGPRGADLQSKHTLGDIITEIDYVAPRAELILPSEDRELIRERILAVNDENSERFVKPLHGARGNGVLVSEDPEEIESFLRRKWKLFAGPYLVQEALKPEQDWRYVLHRDKVQVADGVDPGWRIAYPKVRPEVEGDGSSSVSQLVRNHPGMNMKSRLHVRRNNVADLRRIPEEGERVELVATGNISKGAYSREPEAKELEHLDKFMLQFLSDLEQHFDTRFGTLCFDIGVLDSSVFDRPYDLEEMRKTIVFYEHQLPFGFTGYLKNLPNNGSSNRREAYKAASLKATVTGAVIGSIAESGRIIRLFQDEPYS